MAIQNYSSDIILVTLSSEPKLRRELAGLNEILSTRGVKDVIVDFELVDILSSAAITNLLILHKLTLQAGHRLVLCSIGMGPRCIFRIAGLSEVFEFAETREAAADSILSVRS